MKKQTKSPKLGIVQGNPICAENRRIFLDGSTRSYAALRTAAIGYGRYQPGWRWSAHAGAQTGKDAENHIGYILSGQMMVRTALGHEELIGAGCAFEVAAGGDAWVVGDEPCIALDFIPITDSSFAQSI